MKNFMKKKWKKNIILLALWIGCGTIFYFAFKFAAMPYERLAEIWSNDGKSTQISVFFSEYEAILRQDLLLVEEQIQQLLEQNGIETKAENEQSSISAYSSEGTLAVKGEKGEKTMQAIGVGGDFFFFHPFQVKSGTWFDSSKEESKFVMLNETAAWQIFGSSNIEGKEVQIEGVSYCISGVIKREDSLFSKQSGAEECQIYLPYNILQKHCKNNGITCYELILPNPVQGFAIQTMEKQSICQKENVEIIENSSRFSLQTRLKQLPDFLIQSMQTKEIHYPFWENIARAWENVQNMILVCQIVWGIVGVMIVKRLFSK